MASTENEYRYRVFAEGLNVFGRTDVPIVEFPTLNEAVTWAEARAEPGRTWDIREGTQTIARVEGTNRAVVVR